MFYVNELWVGCSLLRKWDRSEADNHMGIVGLIHYLKGSDWPIADRKRQSHLHGHKGLL